MSNHQKKAQALELHEKGYTVRQIAKRINAQYQTVKRYVDPEYDEVIRLRTKAQKERYRGTCEVCGGPTSYSGRKGQISARFCREHVPTGKRWTREAIIAAIQKWAEEHGRPPSSTDWNATLAHKERGSDYPASGTIYGPPSGVFDSWADAVEAAGFPRPHVRHHGKHGELYWTKERIIDALIAHSENGVAPASPKWKDRAENRPTNSWVAQQFGSWREACHAAGLWTYREHMQRLSNQEAKMWYPEERLAFVQRVMDDHVPRAFLVHKLWRMWGFSNEKAFVRWLRKNGIREFPGRQYQIKRHLNREELQEARILALPPAVRAKQK